MLASEYVDTYEFGFKSNGKRLLSWHYTVGPDGGLHGDAAAVGIYPRAAIAGADYFNFMTYSDTWWAPSKTKRAKFKAGLPIQQSPGSSLDDDDGYCKSTTPAAPAAVSTDGLFGDGQEFLDDDARERYVSLIGVDAIKSDLVPQAHVLRDPAIAERWSTSKHGSVLTFERLVETGARFWKDRSDRHLGDGIPEWIADQVGIAPVPPRRFSSAPHALTLARP
jgi:hypothetical protein